MRFLGLIREGTDLGDLESKLEVRQCKCGCVRTAKVLKTSKQVFFSNECKRRGAGASSDQREKWRSGMDYMIRG